MMVLQRAGISNVSAALTMLRASDREGPFSNNSYTERDT